MLVESDASDAVAETEGAGDGASTSFCNDPTAEPPAITPGPGRGVGGWSGRWSVRGRGWGVRGGGHRYSLANLPPYHRYCLASNDMVSEIYNTLLLLI